MSSINEQHLYPTQTRKRQINDISLPSYKHSVAYVNSSGNYEIMPPILLPNYEGSPYMQKKSAKISNLPETLPTVNYESNTYNTHIGNYGNPNFVTTLEGRTKNNFVYDNPIEYTQSQLYKMSSSYEHVLVRPPILYPNKLS